MTTAWCAAHVAAIDPAAMPVVPRITAGDVAPVLPGLLLWDMWPLQTADGAVAPVAGGSLWMALAAPDRGDPALRHFEARIRLLHLSAAAGWCDLGNALPDGLGDYEREWSGSARLDGDRVTLHFTAAGRRDRPGGYQQRLVVTSGRIDAEGRIQGWTDPVASLAEGAGAYMRVDAQHGEPGKIKAFRDPSFFRDPADGAEYLAFTGSLAGSASAYNGAFGLARRDAAGLWQPLPPPIQAEGLNNELERAHIVRHDGRYYAFWSTQRSVFDPAGPVGPTGLYAMVAERVTGPYRPLNGTGLVLANPPAEPFQTYSWFVTPDLDVISFVDHWGLEGRHPADDPALAASSFGGVPAPVVRIALDGATSRVLDSRPMIRFHG